MWIGLQSAIILWKWCTLCHYLLNQKLAYGTEIKTDTRNSYDLFRSHRALAARLCNPDVEVCDTLTGAVSQHEIKRLQNLDPTNWPKRRPLEVAALGYNAAVLGEPLHGQSIRDRREEARRNARKARPHKSQTNFKGVTWSWKDLQWKVTFLQLHTKPPVVEHLGLFDDEENAARTHDKRVLEYYEPERFLVSNFSSQKLNFLPLCSSSKGQTSKCDNETQKQLGVYNIDGGKFWGASLMRDGIYFRLGEYREVPENERTRSERVYFPFFSSKQSAESALANAKTSKADKMASSKEPLDLFAAMDGVYAIVQNSMDVMLARKGTDELISRQEFEVYWKYFAKQPIPNGLFTREDTNGDGFISRDEFSGPMG